MKIVYYCQHTFGVGHLFRSLEIARALSRHDIIMITGGQKVRIPLPGHVKEYPLPGLHMGADSGGLTSVEADRLITDIKAQRCSRLFSLMAETRPDLFIVELYPFGRKQFDFELRPLLQAIRKGQFGPVAVVCSLRDILVEKIDPSYHERQAIDRLNALFDALLIHADERIVRLSETFSGVGQITIPMVYTGFVASKPHPEAGSRMRQRLGIGRDETLLVASAGGGKAGGPLFNAILDALPFLSEPRGMHLFMFTGPFIPDADFVHLHRNGGQDPRVRISRFSAEFQSFLSAADLSLSMAGYNTCMDLLATGVPALVWPFNENREQRLRAEKLAVRADLSILADSELEPSHLARRIEQMLAGPRRVDPAPIRLDGARQTADWLESRFSGKRTDRL